ncbi:hypothetical protein BH10PSE17_BH10PSE17_37070 [soil metagenome]
MQRVRVIVQDGRVVGTQVVAPVSDGNRPHPVNATLRADIGQTVHEVAASMPASLASTAERQVFHAHLLDLIGRQK